MTSIKQIKKTIVGSFALAGLLMCIFTSNASQQTPAPTMAQAPGQPAPINPLATAPTYSTVQSMAPVTIDTMTTPQVGTSTQTVPSPTITQPTVTTTLPGGHISTTLVPGQSTSTAPFTGQPSTIVSSAPLAAQSNQMSGQTIPTAASTPAPNTSQATDALGLSMTNPTQYPATITLYITPSNRVIQKDIPAGQTVNLLSEPLSKTATYNVSGSLFQTVITKTTITTLSGPTQQTQPSQFINTKTNRISSTKNWSAANPADQKIHLTIDFAERPGGEPTFEIRQQ